MAGCDSNEPDPDLSGRWQGDFMIDEVPVSLSMSLREGADGDVSGSGTISGRFNPSEDNFSFRASDTYAHPNINASLRAEGFQPMRLTGTVSRDRSTITGRLTESGVNATVTLRKK